jgi:hypothetical protein
MTMTAERRRRRRRRRRRKRPPWCSLRESPIRGG